MEQNDISRGLLEIKLNDFRINSGLMPMNAKALSQGFASLLGTSAGKVITVYDGMFSNLDLGLPVEEVKSLVKSDVGTKSKVSFKLPFSNPNHARICGLVAMNYSGFFDSEVDLHSSLVRDLTSNVNSVEDILDACELVGEENSEKYEYLLEEKRQSIYDFGVLMGLNEDKSRLNELKCTMPVRMAEYFDKVVAMHTGTKLGLSWPLPFKRFSGSMKEGLYNDSISQAIQAGVGVDCGFSLPQKAVYERVIDEIKSVQNKISLNGKTFGQRLGLASLPTAAFFLTSMDAYAAQSSYADNPNFLPALATASSSACSSAASSADDNSGFVSTFVPSFICTFTTSL